MWPSHQPQSPAEGDPFDPPVGGESKDSAWQRPVQALVGSAETAAETAQETTQDTVQAVASLWPNLNGGQQRIVAAFLFQRSLSAAAGAALVEPQRECLRAGALRRSEDIEIVTALVRLLVERPLTSTAEAEEVHRAYEHLRQCHWWPSGPEDLPLAALLVAGPAAADDLIARIERLHTALSEGDEVPGDLCALVTLCWTASALSDAQVVMRLGNLRTELLLSGIPLQEDDHAALIILAGIDLEAEVVMREFIDQRRQGQAKSLSRPAPLAVALAADAVALRHLTGGARSAFIASLAIRAWMTGRELQQRRATARFSSKRP